MNKKQAQSQISEAKEARKRFENLRQLVQEVPDCPLTDARSAKSLEKTRKLGSLLRPQQESSGGSENEGLQQVPFRFDNPADVQEVKDRLKLLSKSELISLNRKLLHGTQSLMEKLKTISEDATGALKGAFELKLTKLRRKSDRLISKLEVLTNENFNLNAKLVKKKSRCGQLREALAVNDKRYRDLTEKLASAKKENQTSELQAQRDRQRVTELEVELASLNRQNVASEAAREECERLASRQVQELQEVRDENRRLKEQSGNLRTGRQVAIRLEEEVTELRSDLSHAQSQFFSLEVG